MMTAEMGPKRQAAIYNHRRYQKDFTSLDKCTRTISQSGERFTKPQIFNQQTDESSQHMNSGMESELINKSPYSISKAHADGFLTLRS